MVPSTIHLEMIIRTAVVANTLRIVTLLTLFTAYFLHLQLPNWFEPARRNEIRTGFADSRCEHSEQKNMVLGACPREIFVIMPSGSLENALFLGNLPSKEAKDHDKSLKMWKV